MIRTKSDGIEVIDGIGCSAIDDFDLEKTSRNHFFQS
jgi:hypothetical protein